MPLVDLDSVHLELLAQKFGLGRVPVGVQLVLPLQLPPVGLAEASA